MFGKLLHRQKAGRPIEARTLNRALAEAERVGKLTVSPPLNLQSGPFGLIVSLSLVQPFWAKITGAPNGSGGYPWLQQIEVAGGTWMDGYQSTSAGSPLAYNSIGTGAPTVPVGTIVLMQPSGSANDVRFSAATC